MIIGILGLQGDVIEHCKGLTGLSVAVRLVKRPEDLSGIQGLVMPGGESTAITKLMVNAGLAGPVKALVKSGMPVWGTCAGVVMLCRGGLIGAFDATVKRNAYGPQIYSCVKKGHVKGYETSLSMVFIRAPKILSVSDRVEILSVVDDNIVAARQDNILLTTFHPELTSDQYMARYFTSMIG